MKKIIFVFLYLIISVNLTAQQDFETQWSDVMKVKKQGAIKEFIGITDGKLLVLRKELSSYYIDEYDHDFQLINSVFLRGVSINELYSTYQNVFYLNDQLFLISKLHDKENKKSYLVVSKAEKDKKPTDYLTIFEEETNGKKAAKFSSIASSDGKRMIAVNYNAEESVFNNKVYNSDLTLIEEIDINISEDDKKFYVENYITDNDGNIFILTATKKEENGVARSYKVYSYIFETKEYKQYNLDLKDGWIKEVNFEIRDDHWKISGFYSKEINGGAEGIFHNVYDKVTGETISTSRSEFDSSFKIEVLGQKDYDKNFPIQKYDFDTFIPTENGEGYLAAMRYRRVDFGNSVDFFYDNMIVAKVSSSGKIEFIRNINHEARGSYSESKYYIYNYLYSKKTNELKIIINDASQNIALAKNNEKLKKITKMKGATITCLSISENGDVRREHMLKKNDFNDAINIKTSNTLHISNSEIIVHGVVKGSDYYIGKISCD